MPSALWLLAAVLVLAAGWWALSMQAARRNAAGLSVSMTARGSQLGQLVTRSLGRRLWFMVQSALADRSRKQQLRERYHMQVAEEATQMMGNMKGALMKIGQILSFAAEIVPDNARDALKRLQMDAPP